MSQLPVLLSASAETDIDAALAWYAERSIPASIRFRAEVIAAIDTIAASPHRWPADDEGDRRVVLRRFPFSVVHFVTTDAAIVLAVAHHRKMPKYWHASDR